MFKKLCLALILVLMFTGGAWGFEEDQECEVPAATKVFMMVSASQSMPVMPNMAISVTLGKVITEELAAFFTTESTKYGYPMDYTGARVAQILFDGKIIVVKSTDVVGCK
jgi:hypothetical protein